jgi:hypothetical protein
MDAAECNRKAAECAANAAIAPVESLSAEFLTLAAQWRAMAVREIFLGDLSAHAAPLAEIKDSSNKPGVGPRLLQRK